jgi:RsiW-degrading membrane proteinase PrsW (M82 family)
MCALLKAIFPLWRVRFHRVGFPVDAGIIGFATGAGFSLVENIVYIDSIGGGTPLLWLVRGLGTAVMHGTTTAIIAILAVTGDDRRRHGSRCSSRPRDCFRGARVL